MKLPSLPVATCLVAIPVIAGTFIACGGGGTSATSSGTGGGASTTSSTGTTSNSSGAGASTSGSTGGSASSSGSTSSSASTSSSGGTLFPPGTICNDSGTPRTAPATLKHLIVILEENEDFDQVVGQSAAPY